HRSHEREARPALARASAHRSDSSASTTRAPRARPPPQAPSRRTPRPHALRLRSLRLRAQGERWRPSARGRTRWERARPALELSALRRSAAPARGHRSPGASSPCPHGSGRCAGGNAGLSRSPGPSALALELVEGLGPALLQQARERAIGQELAAGLAAGAVVGLVLRVDDALHGRTADRAGLLVLAVHGHLRADRGDLLREAL